MTEHDAEPADAVGGENSEGQPAEETSGEDARRHAERIEEHGRPAVGRPEG